MHIGFGVTYTRDPDSDFLQAMIRHQQGATNLTKEELEHGRDPEVRALARRVIDPQEGEAAQLRT